MIVVTVELHSAVTGKITTLGKAIIANDGTGTEDKGNYDVAIGRKGTNDLKHIWTMSRKRAHVLQFPRRQSVWVLLTRALIAAGYYE